MVFPDHLVLVRGVGSRGTFETVLGPKLRPGVTELFVHPAVDTPELRDVADDWEARVDDHQLVTADAALRAELRRRRRDPHRLPGAPRPPAGRLSAAQYSVEAVTVASTAL